MGKNLKLNAIEDLKMIWKEKKTNDYVRRKVAEILGENPESVEEIIKQRKLKFYGHQIMKGTMTKVLIEGGVEGVRGKGRPRRQWEDDLKEWSGGWTIERLRRATKDRQWWRTLAHDWVRPRSSRLRHRRSRRRIYKFFCVLRSLCNFTNFF